MRGSRTLETTDRKGRNRESVLIGLAGPPIHLEQFGLELVRWEEEVLWTCPQVAYSWLNMRLRVQTVVCWVGLCLSL